MAKIPTRTRQIIPSGDVAGAFIPSDIADVGQGIEAGAAAGLGREIGGLGEAIGKIAFAEGSGEADNAAVGAESRIKQLEIDLNTENDTKKHSALFATALEDIRGLTPESRIGEGRFQEYIETNLPRWQTGARILGIQKSHDNATGSYIGGIADARNLKNIELANELTNNAEIAGTISPQTAAKDRVTNAKVIENLQEEDALAEVRDLAVERSALAISAIDAELDGRKKKGKPTLFPLVSSQDLLSAKQLAQSAQQSAIAKASAARKQFQQDTENELYDGLADGSKDLGDVARSGLDADAKRRLVRDESDFAERDISRTWPLRDDDTAIDTLEGVLTSVEAGFTDRSEMNQEINRLSVDGKLTRETRGKYRGFAKNEGRDAIDRAVKTNVDIIGNALITRLDDRQARFAVRRLAGDLTPEEQRQAGNTAFLLQVNKHQLSLIEKEIDRRIRDTREGAAVGRDVVSGKEATAIAADVWEEFRAKSLGTRITELKEFTSDRIPIPTGFTRDQWDALSSESRVFIVEGIDKGFSNQELLEALEK